MTECVAVIPARGGSKRVPRKNVRLLSGEPLISWPIRMCIDSGLFSEVLVSTDDPEIAHIAQEYGASVPFVRPAELADDHAPTAAVMVHALMWMQQAGSTASDACCVYPACALLGPEDLSQSLQLLKEHPEADFVVPVAQYPHPVQRALEIADGRLLFVDPSAESTRTQDLPPRWHDAGQFYWGRIPAWLQASRVLSNAIPYIVDSTRICDIDTEEDFARAELLHRLASDDPRR